MTAAAARAGLGIGGEMRALLELFVLPALVALVPHRAGIALARLAARTLPLYDAAAQAGAAQWSAATGNGDAARWLADFRFAQLIDHADLFWALTRPRRFLLARLPPPASALVRGRPAVVLSFHYGQGLWLMAWLASQGVRARFLSVRLERSEAAGGVPFAYARLRIRAVERLAGIAPIFTGGARREIAATLARGESVYGLVDVPVPGACAQPANARLLGVPVLIPAGVLESAAGTGAQALLLTARVRADGSRAVDAELLGDVGRVTPAMLAAALERRLHEAPAAWHFWHLWPRFRAAGA